MKLKNLINNALAPTGYRICKNEPGRNSFSGALKNIKKFWAPDAVFDVGAAIGSWTRECHEFFPAAKYVLVEPLQEFHPVLEKLKEEIKNVSLVESAAAAVAGSITFNVHKDLFGSSLKEEVEGGSVNGQKRTVPTKALDQIEKELNVTGKYFLKLDVQGAELEVLKGAPNVLKNTEALLLEVSLFKSFIGGDALAEIIARLKEYGFVAYDVYGPLYRPYDNALCQIDIIFAKENGLFRTFQGYATKEQREEQNKKFDLLNNNIKR